MTNLQQTSAILILLTANIIVLTYRAETWAAAQKRAGSLALIHIIPLCSGINFGFPADLLHFDRQDFAWFHRWVGRVCVIHSLLHGSLVVSIVKMSTLATPSRFIPMIVRKHTINDSSSIDLSMAANHVQGGCALILIIPVMYAAMRQGHRQFALKCHYVLVILVIAGTTYHVFQRQSVYRWVLLSAIGLWLICSLWVFMRTISARKPSQAVISTCDRMLWLDVTLPLNQVVRSGQYMQMWMPSAGIRAFVQLPLLYVVVCELDDTSGELTVRMVARPQSGITSNLYWIARDLPKRLSVRLLGPYGRPLDLSRFGTVVFVLEDIGLFRALSYIKMLVEASHKREVMVRRLDIMWQRDEKFGGYRASQKSSLVQEQVTDGNFRGSAMVRDMATAAA
jgi:hypothetical protein